MIQKELFIWILTQGYPVKLDDKEVLEMRELLLKALEEEFFVYQMDGKIQISKPPIDLLAIQVTNELISFHPPDGSKELVNFKDCGSAVIACIKTIFDYPPAIRIPIPADQISGAFKGKKNFWAI